MLTGSVNITGFAKVDRELTANTGSLGGSGTISYQWQIDASADGTYTDISGATTGTYTPVTDDVGKYLKVTVTRAGFSGSVTSPATAAVVSADTPDPTVTAVTVTGPDSVAKGQSETYAVTVTGTDNPSQTVTWSIVETGGKAGTAIDGNGVLSIAGDEALASITVKAVSTFDEDQYGTKTVTITGGLSSANNITAFGFTTPPAAGNIDGDTRTVTVPYATDLTQELTPTIMVSPGASVSPASGEPQDFTDLVTYTVTAEDGSEAEWTVTVEEGLNSANDITAFGFTTPSATGDIDGDTLTITVTVPYGTTVISLVPSITVSPDASVSPASGEPQNFTDPVTYTVTAEDGSEAEWTVTVKKDIGLAIADSIAEALASNSSAGNSAANPISLSLPGDIDLSISGMWADILTAIQSAGKYVDLDLSACTGVTEFDPGTANTGEKYIVSLVLPATAASIKAGDYSNPAFRYFTGLKSLTGGNVKTVGNFAFYGCTALATVSLPEATSIGDRAFLRCTVLATVSLPEATSIGDYAFGFTGTTKALTITLGTTVPTLGVSMFSSVNAAKTVTVKVPNNAAWSGIISGSPYTGSENTTGGPHWGEGFRGRGWTSDGVYESGGVNTNISLTIEALP